jgi:hypothetical protein
MLADKGSSWHAPRGQVRGVHGGGDLGVGLVVGVGLVLALEDSILKEEDAAQQHCDGARAVQIQAVLYSPAFST